MPRALLSSEEARSQGRLWTPRQARADLILAADLGAFLRDGSGNVERWRDSSGYGNDAYQATSGSRPGYDASRACPNWTADAHLPVAGAGVTLNNYTLAVLWDIDESYAQAQIGVLTTGNSATEGSPHLLLQSPDCTVPNASVYTAAGAYSSSWTVSTSWNVTVLQNNGGTNGETTWSNGVQRYTRTHTSTGGNNQNLYIGSGYIRAFRGRIGCVVRIPRSVAGWERQLIEGWMAWQAGVAGSCLPATHPWRNAPPYIGG